MLNLAAYINSPDRSTKSTTSSFNALCVLVNTRFQVLFHSPPGVLFTFPSQYCSSIGHRLVFRLGGWSPRVPCGFLVSAGTLDTANFTRHFGYKTLTFFGWVSHLILLWLVSYIAVLTPVILLPQVWPLSLSLATTRKISVDFFSSAYLDVSVRRVPSVMLCIHITVAQFELCRVSPFGNLRILRLFAPPRSLSQLIASFVGFRCQGIPLVLFLAWTSFF